MQIFDVTSMRIFVALLRRSFFILIPQLKNTLIDGIFLTSTYVLLFGYLYPEMGMEKTLIGPVFVGSLLTLLSSLSFSLAVRVVLDLKYHRFIDYLFTLPIAKGWLFASYVASFFVELFMAVSPLLIFGLTLLHKKIAVDVQWCPFALIFSGSLLFYSILFLAVSILYDYDWFFDNIWPRRLSPLLIASCALFPWYRVNAFSSLLGSLFLLNPITYVAEGLRGSLFEASTSLSPFLCIIMLCFYNMLAVGLLMYSINKTFKTVSL